MPTMSCGHGCLCRSGSEAGFCVSFVRLVFAGTPGMTIGLASFVRCAAECYNARCGAPPGGSRTALAC